MTRSLAGRSKWEAAGVLAAAWALCGFVFTLRAWPAIDTAVDDAYISARYAAHAAEGWGFVYNAGEPPVEGFTNLLWTAAVALGLFVGIPAQPLIVWMGYGFGLLVIGGAMAVALSIFGRERWWLAVLPALMIALDRHFAVVATNGLESSMFMAFLLWSIAGMWSVRGPWRWGVGVLLGLFCLVRPEGVVVSGCLLLIDLVARRRQLREVETWAPWVGVIGIFGASVLWRYWTYGAWVPNTAAAKGAHHDVAETVRRNVGYLGGDGDYWIAFASVALLAAIFPPYRTKKYLALGIGLVTFVIAMRVPLWMPGGRLMLPFAALAYVVFAGPLMQLRPLPATMWATLMFLGGIYLLTDDHNAFVLRQDRIHSVVPGNGTQIAARHIAEHVPDGSWMATRDAGLLAFEVGTGVKVAELHERALTLPHPDGEDIPLEVAVPMVPELLVFTTNREQKDKIYYGRERRLWRDRKAEYVYYGRVQQHYHRYYDVYVRSDIEMPPLPSRAVVNYKGAIKGAKRLRDDSR